MTKTKKIRKEREMTERLSWFSPTPQNETLLKDGFVYFKHWDGNKNRWSVSQFTPQSWANMKGLSYRQIETNKKNEEMKQVSLELEQKYFID